ncbi:ATP-dependent DNA helicase [Microbacterium sp. SORGH_AS_0888]|uniref:ATP-dependent DNA helicase n=1 Tax=Microbacterium sp. SORGH_AS_0888 TaxID=3041791 RepID=UPI0027870E50|nr:ATP-dependent DNA helicase [Microbacterium sp. SORGH_AS_0888]MDQ1128199.1 DNA helicase-2/ATP-dependent DNA helicase PcrA [Microbacterium sp. SORGH_AS_0888]
MSAPRVSAAALAAALGQFAPTSEQTAVIESPLAPALVVAGAGSGKTETMAARVVWLVANRFVRRDQVLGLTFTRKAAGELGERIGRRLARLAEFERAGLVPQLDALNDSGALVVFGQAERSGDDDLRRRALEALSRRHPGVPDVVDTLLERPTVTTYNGFADGIVREHAVRIGLDPESTLLSESAAWLLMRRTVLSSDDARLEQRPESVRSIVDAALRIARDTVDNLASLDEVAQLAEQFAAVRELPSENRRTTVYREVADAADRVGALPLLADLAREYDDAKRRLGVLDFSDQVAGAVRAVRAAPEVAAELRERYRVVLLDEYQDTSVVQTQLLAGIFARTPVMAVGDPHQSIYGWRGASAGNLGDFPRAFAPEGGCGRFALLTSWRNARGVLVAANAVLEPLASSAPVEVGELRPRPGAPTGTVELAQASDVDAEADRVAEWFVRVRAERRGEGLPTTGAVLFRSKRHMVRFADALGRRGVPHRILGLGGLLSTPEVVDVVSALRVIADPDAGSALLRLLAGPRWSVGLADLGALSRLARRLGGEEGQAPLSDALDALLRGGDDGAARADFTPTGLARLREAAGVFAGLRRAAGMPIPELLRVIEVELRLDIELAANESRGSARVAGAQLRAFGDEVRAFLAADERGTVASLLAWLDHAERLDEFAPRTEPPEDDVVQLLTIHGSKGLEWDAVAVVRLVEDELPTLPRDTKGWLAFGVLPAVFRGDAAWLPDIDWRAAATQQELRAALEAYVERNKARARAEDRRLAYVAVTRARDRLLLSCSPWAGGSRPRRPSRFLVEIAGALEIPLAAEDAGENPFAGARRLLTWPLDPLGARRSRVEEAAAAVRAAQQGPPAPAEPDLALLLAERDAAAGDDARAPVRIPASRYKEFVADYDAAVRRLARPLPERPYRQTRLGTLFHAWVEQRSGVAAGAASVDDPLWDDAAEVAQGGDDAVALERMQRTFEESEWGGLAPIAVETEIDFRHTGLDGREHVVICKLDAVYERGDRIEIVDWKTGRSPRTDAERAERLVQLDLYRQAYHQRHGIPVDRIDVALFYVADGVVIRA